MNVPKHEFIIMQFKKMYCSYLFTIKKKLDVPVQINVFIFIYFLINYP